MQHLFCRKNRFNITVDGGPASAALHRNKYFDWDVDRNTIQLIPFQISFTKFMNMSKNIYICIHIQIYSSLAFTSNMKGLH
jgi:hypothetical protein